MLGEGFLRVLRYREERRFASAPKPKSSQTNSQCTDLCSGITDSASEQFTESAEADPNLDKPDSDQFQGLKVIHQGPAGLLIPGSSPLPALEADFCLEDCSLLEQYPDLQVADSGRISHNPLRPIITHNLIPGVSNHPAVQDPQSEPVPSISDQGYLVMGASVSLDLPGSALEPMSNSVLNGLLEKQLEEVYMQHLTDNLARCHSHLGPSLLHGLVPPLQPCSQLGGPDSLEASLEGEPGGDRGKKISYLSTQNLAPCSSNFSSPVLRISEAENAHL
ncbi:uncharacterized protein si:dkey-237j10.2 [Cheilinus undulatus]|uniref:uncharacterized protein si:dkey-237j10.2 n=1 Tax=Cheilinus undulatus TaxID=241271 RepID=UPI001BD1DD5F|nr:uncharacterized protein si:dkey-237j10.2 [Cheilinus undulatus]